MNKVKMIICVEEGSKYEVSVNRTQLEHVSEF